MGQTFSGAGGGSDDGEDPGGAKGFGLRAAKGVLAGVGNALQRQDDPNTKPVDFSRLGGPKVRQPSNLPYQQPDNFSPGPQTTDFNPVYKRNANFVD